MKLSISGIVGIEVDDSYRWKDTLYFNNDVATVNDNDFNNCEVYIRVKYATDLTLNDCRDIGNGLLIGNNVFIDKEYGVRIERKNNEFCLTATQECNEWLIVCFQLSLLEKGYTFIHAAGLEKEGKAVLLPSWGGVGKTATVVRMVNEQGWKLMGDDLILVNSEGKAIPFLKPFVIYGYHKPLFPKLFESKKTIIKNNVISNLLRYMIPTIKKTLRVMPGVLAYARKHNPHSMRVSPYELFEFNQLSSGGQINHIIWLERMIGENNMNELDISDIASKATAVTLMEVFGDRTEAVYAMCGCGMLQYEDLYIKMYEIVKNTFKSISPLQLNISTSVPIENVGTKVMENLNKVISK